MLKYCSVIFAFFMACGAFFMVTGCKEGKAGFFSLKSEYIVGKDISPNEIQDFYYTVDASTYPPYFQRYRFTNKNGQYSFYHEKREGNDWPLTEKHITVKGTVKLDSEQWNEFLRCINDGKVTKRKDDANAGGRGPWLYIYWTNDKGCYQVFKFIRNEQLIKFEKMCADLKIKN